MAIGVSTYGVLDAAMVETAAYCLSKEGALAMTTTEIRQQIYQQIDQLPLDQLSLVADFLQFLQFKLAKTANSSTQSRNLAEAGEPVLTGSKVADLMQFAGTWQGDDFEECLQAVYDARLPAEF